MKFNQENNNQGNVNNTIEVKNGITLTEEECEIVHDMIGMLSGDNPENVFAWDGTDNLDCPETRVFAKIYQASGHKIPDSCKGVK